MYIPHPSPLHHCIIPLIFIVIIPSILLLEHNLCLIFFSKEVFVRVTKTNHPMQSRTPNVVFFCLHFNVSWARNYCVGEVFNRKRSFERFLQGVFSESEKKKKKKERSVAISLGGPRL